jgi:serine/threonine protein kinase
VHGGPKFADIGLVTEAREPGRDVSLLGTEGYMAPEGPGSALADLFSLGKLIYELCTGHDRRVFPDMPTSLIEGTPDPDMEELYRIVLKACEFEPRYRYQSAEELQADLRKLETAG